MNAHRTPSWFDRCSVLSLYYILFGNNKKKRGCCLADTVNNAKSTKITLLWFRTSLNNNQIKPKLRQNIKQHDVLATFLFSSFCFSRGILLKKRILWKEMTRNQMSATVSQRKVKCFLFDEIFILFSTFFLFFFFRGESKQTKFNNFKFIALRFQA